MGMGNSEGHALPGSQRAFCARGGAFAMLTEGVWNPLSVGSQEEVEVLK